MKIKAALTIALLGASLLGSNQVMAELANTDSLNRFISQMVKQHHFNEAELRQLFQSVNIQQPILDAMAKPAEAKPWYQYRDIFMTDARIDGGVQFWRDNESALKAVELQYGVPAEIIIAIIGVETKYGAHTGKYRVIDALATLGFAYPSRSEFFLKELENFLLLSREEHVDPLQPMGSYAGAMGLSQFMPSSYRAYAKDFDQDHKRDIWHNSGDAIASVANYFVANQWRRGGPIAFQVTAVGDAYKQALNKGVKPDMPVGQLRKLGIGIPAQLADSEHAKLLSYPMLDHEQLWLGLHNFYVITRYNHSPLYAMAVHQLSHAIREKMLRS
ncbi:lytic murein transglycosylase B [Methylomonas sp. LL1]|uniref:lytic murein transglycosylase B n=1 Tax=Methylomonas sp. LL1 TaxID=2785785 RepID=UPI0018C3E4F1|nr:lytic murein transglycosylase B [Methylomonas sp. LL1]QPK61896.1 lytic murein transglycosylase B [Methylomonas sp. LL1]